MQSNPDREMQGGQFVPPKPFVMPTWHTYDIHNPTGRARVIFDGLNDKGGAMVRIEPGETLKGVKLAEHVEDRLAEIAEKVGASGELQLKRLQPVNVSKQLPAPTTGKRGGR